MMPPRLYRDGFTEEASLSTRELGRTSVLARGFYLELADGAGVFADCSPGLPKTPVSASHDV
jgi:hypothetical protein